MPFVNWNYVLVLECSILGFTTRGSFDDSGANTVFLMGVTKWYNATLPHKARLNIFAALTRSILPFSKSVMFLINPRW